MSMLTKFLKLFKYDPATDGARTFNIDTAINEPYDKIDKFAEDADARLSTAQQTADSAQQRADDAYEHSDELLAAERQVSGGTLATLSDMIPGQNLLLLNVYGNSWHNNTPGPTTPDPINSARSPILLKRIGANILQPPTAGAIVNAGVTYTFDGVQSVTLSGTASDRSVAVIRSISLEPGTYTLSGCPAGGSGSTYRMTADTAMDAGSGASFTLTTKTTVTVRIYINAGVVTDGLKFSPQITYGTEVLQNEPYSEQTTSISIKTQDGTVHALRGIGDYRDCLTNDNLQTRIASYTFTGTEAMTLRNNCVDVKIPVDNVYYPGDKSPDILCSHFPVFGRTDLQVTDKTGIAIGGISPSTVATIRIKGTTTVEAVRNILAKGTVELLYPLATTVTEPLDDAVKTAIRSAMLIDGSIQPLSYSASSNTVLSLMVEYRAWGAAATQDQIVSLQEQIDDRPLEKSVADRLAGKSDTNHKHAAADITSGVLAKARGGTGNTNGTADTLTTARAIDGLPFDGSAAIAHYTTCSSAASTAAKTAALTGFVRTTGARVSVKFANANTAVSPTLNVGGTGAATIQYRGGEIAPGQLCGVVPFVFDGTYWQIASAAQDMTFSVALGTGSWATSGGQSKKIVSVAGVTADMVLTLAPVLSGTATTDAETLRQVRMISRVQTQAGSIAFTCMGNVPTQSITFTARGGV